jgi:hypothetical protein
MNSEKEMKEKIISLEERIEKIERVVFSAEAPFDNSMLIKRKKTSAKEFLMTKNVKSDTQKVVALGYFLEHTEGMESFNVNDLEEVFRSAKEKVPGNMNDAVNKNISRGFLMEAAVKKDAKKSWCLTSTGENYIETKLGK